MNRFELHTKVEKEKIKTKFGVVSIRNIKFDSTDIQKILPDIIFEDNNLKFMFQKDAFLGRDKVLVLKRFLPNKDVEDITKFIIESINSNKTFVVLHAKCKNVANKMQKIGFKKRHFNWLLNAK